MLFSLILFLTVSIEAQEASPVPENTGVSVPDLAGLSLPAAEARLNLAGLRLGSISIVSWSATAGGQQNTVEAQVPLAGSTVPTGSMVDLSVWRAEQVLLVFDDNDLTLINLSDREISLRRVVFRSVDGNTPTEFQADEWANRLRAGSQCMQIWSIATNSTRPVEGCDVIQKWLYRTTDVTHFWTGENRATRFEVIQDGIQRGTCTINEGKCVLYLAPVDGESRSGIPTDTAEYVTLFYTPDVLRLQNRTTDRWLPLADLKIGGIDTAAAGDSDRPEGNRLAPGQCLVWTGDQAPAADAYPGCTRIVGSETLPTIDVFWTREFRVESRIDGQPRTCPPAVPGQEVMCLLPRLKEAG